jgi:hypothetical protein
VDVKEWLFLKKHLIFFLVFTGVESTSPTAQRQTIKSEIMEVVEIWASIKNGYEGLYESSNKGRLKSFHFSKEGRVLKGRVRIDGYYEYSLVKDGKQKFIKGHQLVAMAFLGHSPCGFKLIVNHINFNKTDNRVENLEIITSRENSNKKHLKSSSKYTGVSLDKKAGKWKSVICIDKKIITIGRFKTEEEASNAYQEKLLKL